MTAKTKSTKALRLKADSDESIKHDERMASAICKLGGGWRSSAGWRM